MVDGFGKLDQLLDLLRELGSIERCSVAETSTAGSASLTDLDERHFGTPTTQLARPHPQQLALGVDYCVRVQTVARPREFLPQNVRVLNTRRSSKKHCFEKRSKLLMQRWLAGLAKKY